MSRYPGRILSSTAPTVNANTAKGIWTLDEALRYSRAGQWPVPTGGGDPFFQYNTMLLPGQGTTGMQNHSFLDSSSNNFTVNRSGNTTQGTFTPFSGANGYWSLYVGGAGYQTWTTATNYSGTDITVECWVYATAATTSFTSLVSSNSGTGNYNQYFNLAIDGSNRLACNVYGASNTALNNTSTIPLNQWVHCAFVLTSGGTLSLYENGVRVATTSSASIASVTTNIQVGGIVQTSGGTYISYFNGYISNARINRSAVYSGASFSVPTSPLTNNANTNLLVCQSNRVVDNSGNNYTASSALTITPFQPFGAPTTAYSASTIGGSGYFDGSADFLSVANNAAFNFGSGAFTIEFWYYPTTLSGTQCLITNYGGSTTGFVIQMGGSTAGSGKIDAGFSGDGADITSTNAVKLNSWNHIAISGTPGATGIKLFINGAQEGSTYTGATSLDTSSTLLIGEVASTNRLSGYLSGLRLLKGTAQYTTTFTPPTEPPTAIANTSLLLNYTNAGIIDNAQKNDLETVGGAQISTTQYKWGASSMYFDGTGDYLMMRNTENLTLGTGDFTIEFWVYYNSGLTADVALFDCRPASTAGVYPLIYSNTTGKIVWYINSAARITGTTTLTTNTWYHVAVMRTGGSTKLFINGNQDGSTYADTNNYLLGTNRPVIGAAGATLGADPLNGYISDLRITKGYARYPYNFTAPTAALPLFYQAAATPSSDPYFENTTLLLPGNGTNGAQNNTFLDSSTNNFSITRNGNTTQGTFTPFSQTGWGNFFDGSGDYLTVASSADFNIFNGDMTFECWFYSTAASLGSRSEHLFAFVQDATNRESLYFNGTTLTFWTSSSAGNGPRITYANTPQNQWIHVAVTKSGSTFTMYINGVSVGTSTTTQYSTSNQSLQIGTYNNAGTAADSFTGYISNVRVVKGTNVYTTNFIPSTTRLTPVTNTVLLTCQSNRFIDTNTQTTAKTVTPSGDTSVQAFSPFNPTAAYSTSTVGGSGYFDGSGDYLTIPSDTAFNFGTGAFSVEFWVYITSLAENPSLINTNSTTIFYEVGGSNRGLCLFASSANQLTSAPTVLPIGAWSHVVVCRNSSGNLSSFVNGTRLDTKTSNTSTIDFSGAIINRYFPSSGGHLFGYTSSLRLIKGSTPYDPTSTTITVPTAPVTNITNTSLLLNFTNGGIIDNTAKNNLETVGGASISTTVSKFGGSSMYFDGTTDCLFRPTSPNFGYGTGDFTIEFWLYLNAVGTQTIVSNLATAGSTAPHIYYLTGSGLKYFTASADRIAGPALSTGTWYHIAISRYSSSTRMFVNGSQVGSTYADSNNYDATAPLGVGDYGSTPTGSNTLNGYINDLRITKGIARYTQNFTPPTSAFLTL